jgi:hypothetical protein
MPKTDDELFNEAYTVFQKFFQICVENRQEEFHAKIGTAARQMRASDFLFARLTLDKEHAKNIGEDFLVMYDTHINPKCGLISKNAEGILYGRLSLLYRGLGKNAENSIQSKYASQGWDIKGSKSSTDVSIGYYNNANSKYLKRLDAKIEEHNFELRRNKENRNSEKNIDVLANEKIIKTEEELFSERARELENESKNIYQKIWTNIR